MPQKHRRFVRSVQAAVSRVRHPGAEEIKQNRPKNRRKTKCSAQDLAVGRKSCPFPAGYRPKLSARCAEFVPGLVRQIDFRLSARLNRAMTGESLRQTDTNFESEENTMKKILALLLAVAMIAAFCACAQQSADTAPAASTDTAAETTTDTAAETPAAETRRFRRRAHQGRHHQQRPQRVRLPHRQRQGPEGHVHRGKRL